MLALAAGAPPSEARDSLKPKIPPFVGEIIGLRDGPNPIDLTNHGPPGLVVVANHPSYGPYDYSLILVMASVKNINGGEYWQLVPVDRFAFPWRKRPGRFDVVRDSMFVEAPHDGDYDQAVVMAREPRGSEFVVTVYVASRSGRGEYYAPTVVDLVKFELAKSEASPADRAVGLEPRTDWHFHPVAAARSQRLYVNALEALACEIGVAGHEFSGNFDKTTCVDKPLYRNTGKAVRKP